MAQEIERKFIAAVDIPTLRPTEVLMREQGYLPTSGGSEYRISRYTGLAGTACFSTKSGSGLIREEHEFHIADVFADHLLSTVNPLKIITKTRLQKDRWEIDVYHGKLTGLVIAEMELKYPNETTPVAPPGLILLKEVTQDANFKNSSLANLSEGGAVAFVSMVKVIAAAELIKC